MSTRNKYYLFLWCVILSGIAGASTTWLIIRYPAHQYVLGGGMFVFYFVVLVIGVRKIVSLSKN
jgi:hypothetical protein